MDEDKTMAELVHEYMQPTISRIEEKKSSLDGMLSYVLSEAIYYLQLEEIMVPVVLWCIWWGGVATYEGHGKVRIDWRYRLPMKNIVVRITSS